MDDRPAHRQFCAVAQRWQALAERRRAHFADLYQSGRWRRYFTERQFLERMRDVTATCERWDLIVAAAKPADAATGEITPAPAADQRDAA